MAYRKVIMLPVSPNDLPGVQGWLQGLAVQGLHLEACDNGTFVFQTKEYVQRRYRIDPSKGTALGVATPGLMDMYQEFGWHYIDSYDRYHHVFYTDDPDAVEPFVSPEALYDGLERIRRKKLISHISSILLLLVLTVWIWIAGERTWFQKVLDGLILISISLNTYCEIKPLFHVKQNLSDSNVLNPYSLYKKDPMVSKLRVISFVLVIVLILNLLYLRGR